METRMARKHPHWRRLFGDLTNLQPGFHSLTRKQWTVANRIQTRHDRTAANLHLWGCRDFPMLEMAQDIDHIMAAPQDVDHIILDTQL